MSRILPAGTADDAFEASRLAAQMMRSLGNGYERCRGPPTPMIDTAEGV